MKTYTVKEISDMLKIDPETVRRWIRSGKLQAEQSSRKDGNVVTDQMLQSFLRQSPKYAKMVAPLVATPVGATVTVASVLTGIIAQQYVKNEKVKNAQVNVKEIISLLEDEIKSHEINVESKQKVIKQLQYDIAMEQQNINEKKALLEKMKMEE